MARSSGRAAVTATLTLILLLALAAIPAVVYLGSSSTDAPTTTPAARERETAPVEPDIPEPDYSTFVENSTGSQVSFYRLSDGHRTGTATERFARPALSLIKLYIAEYVLEHGSVAEQYQADQIVAGLSAPRVRLVFDVASRTRPTAAEPGPAATADAPATQDAGDAKVVACALPKDDLDMAELAKLEMVC